MVWKPDGYTSVAPYLVVDGAQRTIDFLTVVFDAQPLRMHPMGERLGHAEVRIDDTVLSVRTSRPLGMSFTSILKAKASASRSFQRSVSRRRSSSSVKR